MDWLDQDLSFKEGRETTREDDSGTSYKVSRHSRSIAQRKDIGSSYKGKAHRIISSSSSSNDGAIESIKGVATLVGAIKMVKTLIGTMGVAL